MSRTDQGSLRAGQGCRRFGFEAAIREGIERASKTLRNVESAWVKDMNVVIDNESIQGYRMNLEVTLVLEDRA